MLDAAMLDAATQSRALRPPSEGFGEGSPTSELRSSGALRCSLSSRGATVPSPISWQRALLFELGPILSSPLSPAVLSLLLLPEFLPSTSLQLARWPPSGLIHADRIQCKHGM